jgi:hypothetical protein
MMHMSLQGRKNGDELSNRDELRNGHSIKTCQGKANLAIINRKANSAFRDQEKKKVL